ncbi:MAG: GNAT family N-acetyltransferase [Elusimicrobia bacterium]|nr:GNAT family N-acetyltransferase [Elusimicrobiota bacterium]
MPKSSLALEFFPATPQRWEDIEQLFGPRGACAGCWCMWWKRPRSEWTKNKGAGNKKAFRKIVGDGRVPGILAYAEGQPVGWCAVEPREKYPGLERARTLKKIDDQPVWSVTCFFVAKEFRRKGVAVALLKEARSWARSKGARILEGYPVETKTDRAPDAFMWTGTAAAFRKAGFHEALRRSASRPIMRLSFTKRPEP